MSSIFLMIMKVNSNFFLPKNRVNQIYQDKILNFLFIFTFIVIFSSPIHKTMIADLDFFSFCSKYLGL